jgi:hypothetical protein
MFRMRALVVVGGVHTSGSDSGGSIGSSRILGICARILALQSLDLGQSLPPQLLAPGRVGNLSVLDSEGAGQKCGSRAHGATHKRQPRVKMAHSARARSDVTVRRGAVGPTF